MSSVSISNKKKTLAPYNQLLEKLKVLLGKDRWCECYMTDIPKHWERHGNLILLPSSCFYNVIWNDYPDLWEIVAKTLKCKKLARKHSVNADKFRSPQVELLLGENGWTTCIENGIKYTYDVTKCMFSAGNITEKIRISKFDCKGETVVDMYAGIGYFTLPYLVYAKANVVHACEWNPNAIEALERNLVLNKVKDQCVIHYGDCREICPVGIADRVNLGLLPTSESGWRTACLALNCSKGGILHIHSNVTSGVGVTSTAYLNDIDNKIQNVARIFELKEKCSDKNKLHHQTVRDNNNGEKSKQDNKTVLFLSGKEEWQVWGNKTVQKIKELIFENYAISWNVTLLNIQHIKSYAPHIDHIVADIECRPKNVCKIFINE